MNKKGVEISISNAYASNCCFGSRNNSKVLPCSTPIIPFYLSLRTLSRMYRKDGIEEMIEQRY